MDLSTNYGSPVGNPFSAFLQRMSTGGPMGREARLMRYQTELQDYRDQRQHARNLETLQIKNRMGPSRQSQFEAQQAMRMERLRQQGALTLDQQKHQNSLEAATHQNSLESNLLAQKTKHDKQVAKAQAKGAARVEEAKGAAKVAEVQARGENQLAVKQEQTAQQAQSQEARLKLKRQDVNQERWLIRRGDQAGGASSPEQTMAENGIDQSKVIPPWHAPVVAGLMSLGKSRKEAEDAAVSARGKVPHNSGPGPALTASLAHFAPPDL